MTLNTMYPGLTNSPQTKLVQPINASAATIEVEDGTVFPAAPNLAVIGIDESAETVLYSSINGNILSGVQRGLEGAARAWGAGAYIGRNWTNKDYTALINNITGLNNGKAESAHNHSASDINSGALPIARGGTGATSASAALSALGGAPSSHSHPASDINSGALPIARGGTGATSASAALSALGGVSSSNVLTKTNATAFTPTSDFHPATKAYVDSMQSGHSGLVASDGNSYVPVIANTELHPYAVSALLGGEGEGSVGAFHVDATHIYCANEALKKVQRVRKFDLVKEHESAAQPGYSVAIDGDDNYIYYCDAVSKKVVKMHKWSLAAAAESAALAGFPRQITSDGSFLYICVGTANTVVKMQKSNLSVVATSAAQSDLGGIASDDTYVYVTDTSSRRVVKMQKSNLSTVATGAAQAHGLRAVAVDSTHVYCATSNGSIILKMLKSNLGSVTASAAISQGIWATTLSGAYVFCSDSINKKIYKIQKSDLSVKAESPVTGCGSYVIAADGASCYTVDFVMNIIIKSHIYDTLAGYERMVV